MQVDEGLSGLVRERGQHLINVAYQLTHDRAAAEDVVQEALLQVYRSWRVRHGQPAQLEAYVRRAMLNVFLKKFERDRHLPVSGTQEPQHLPTGLFEAQIDDRAQVWQLLEGLSARQRAVLVLRFYEQLSDDEISYALGCRPATVRSLAARGLAQLRTQVVSEAALREVPL